VTPEILIVGDPAQHDDLIHRVQECRYEVAVCQPRELNRRIRMQSVPAAIIVCIQDADPALLLAGLRRSRAGAAIPVILLGSLGGEISDLADVLDLGADHFLEEPVDPGSLIEVLAELAGPASGQTETGIIAPPPRVQDDTAKDNTLVEEPRSPQEEERAPSEAEDFAAGPFTSKDHTENEPPASTSDTMSTESIPSVRPALGNLHETLDRLEARLKERDRRDRSSDADGIDLESMGLEGIPDVDAGIENGDSIDPADSGVRRSLMGDGAGRRGRGFASENHSGQGRGRPGTAAVSGGGSESTELLAGGSGSFPRAGGEETGSRAGGERRAVLRGRRPDRGGSTRGGSRSRPDDPSGPRESKIGDFGRPREREPSRRLDSRPAEAGKIERGEVPKLLWRLHDSRYTGSLSLQRDRTEKRLWFEDGALRFVRSNDASDRFVDGLLRRGVLTRPQYETARRLAAKEPRRVGRLLVEAGFLKSAELAALLRDHLARVMDGTFSWNSGSYRLDIDDRCDESIRLELPMQALILEGVRHRMDTGDLRHMLWRDAGGELLCPRLKVGEREREAEIDAAVTTLRLLPDEELWVRRFDGRHPMAALLDLHDDEAGLLSVVYTMSVCGMVDFDQDDQGKAASEQGDDLDDWTPRSEGDPVEIDGQRIVDRLRLAREADYFEFLGLMRDASRAEVRRAHRELRSTFMDSRLEEAAGRRWAGELMELRAALDEARDILLDDAMRSAYLAHLGDA
jgi:CheY-like chemotaxis protein